MINTFNSMNSLDVSVPPTLPFIPWNVWVNTKNLGLCTKVLQARAWAHTLLSQLTTVAPAYLILLYQNCSHQYTVSLLLLLANHPLAQIWWIWLHQVIWGKGVVRNFELWNLLHSKGLHDPVSKCLLSGDFAGTSEIL